MPQDDIMQQHPHANTSQPAPARNQLSALMFSDAGLPRQQSKAPTLG